MSKEAVAQVRSFLSWAPDWVIAIGLLLIAVTVAFILHGVLLSAIRRALKLTHPLLLDIAHQTRRMTRFVIVVALLAVFLQFAPLDPDTAATMQQVIVAALVILGGWILQVVTNVTADRYMARFELDVTDNLIARKQVTQVRVLKRAVNVLIILLTVGFALMTFESIRNFGISLFASAGVAGLIVGFAARPVLSNLIAGVQLAITQPIRLDDAVVIEGEWGWIEEITATYVVIRIWDWRRLIVPLSYLLEKPFQNWTRTSASIIGSVHLYADYTVPVDRLREEFDEILRQSENWDGEVKSLQVTNASERTVELRALMSARTSPAAWDLRCEVREKLIAYLQREYPEVLPRQRAEVEFRGGAASEQDSRRQLGTGGSERG
jgi:small-conductance mechanosensitive channel